MFLDVFEIVLQQKDSNVSLNQIKLLAKRYAVHSVCICIQQYLLSFRHDVCCLCKCQHALWNRNEIYVLENGRLRLCFVVICPAFNSQSAEWYVNWVIAFYITPITCNSEHFIWTVTQFWRALITTRLAPYGFSLHCKYPPLQVQTVTLIRGYACTPILSLRCRNRRSCVAVQILTDRIVDEIAVPTAERSRWQALSLSRHFILF